MTRPNGNIDRFWCVDVSQGYDPETGARRRKTFSFRIREGEGDTARRQALAKIKEPVEPAPTTRSAKRADALTLVQYLRDVWLPDVKKRGGSENTLAFYEGRVDIIERYVKDVLLKDFDEDRAEQLLGEDGDMERRDPDGSYARKSVHLILGIAFRRGMKLRTPADRKKRYIVHNPMTAVEPPEHTTARKDALTQDEAKKLLDAAKGERLGAFFWLALFGGLRINEALGLLWTDVDLDAKTVKVSGSLKNVGGRTWRGSPKTASGYRTMRVPDEVIDALRQRQQIAQSEPHRGKSNFVLCKFADGDMLKASQFRSSVWERVVKRAKLPASTKPHACRVTTTTLLHGNGASLTSLAEYLGHADGTQILKVYARVTEAERKRNAKTIGKLLG